MRIALALVLVAACGYPALDNTGKTDGGTGDGSSHGSGDGSVGHCDAQATYGTVTGVTPGADYWPGTGQDPDELNYVAGISASDGVFIDLLSDDPKFGGGGISAPVTFQITGAQLNFSTCGGCVVIGAKCNNCSPYTGQGTAAYYMATGGTLQIDQVNPHIKGKLTNVTFEHVTIDNTGSQPSFQSTPVGDGCVSKIVSMAFDTAVTVH